MNIPLTKNQLQSLVLDLNELVGVDVGEWDGVGIPPFREVPMGTVFYDSYYKRFAFLIGSSHSEWQNHHNWKHIMKIYAGKQRGNKENTDE